MSKNVEHVHHGHRQRLKSKVKEFGLESLKEHEVLELLLTYTIPRKDTNELAHNLLDKFGTFTKTIDAAFKEFVKVNGVGVETALFFNVLSELIRYYNASKSKEGNMLITTSALGITYFRQRFCVEDYEFMHIICVSKKGNILNSITIKGQDDVEVKLDMRELVNNINLKGVNSIMVFHTHPNGDLKPTKDDIITTQRIMNLCQLIGIQLTDHIILNETEHYSMKKYEDWDGMLKKSTKFTKEVGNI